MDYQKLYEVITMVYNISVDADACIGCGACANICENFEVKEGKAVPVQSKVDDISCNQDAADACPVNAIHVEEA